MLVRILTSLKADWASRWWTSRSHRWHVLLCCPPPYLELGGGSFCYLDALESKFVTVWQAFISFEHRWLFSIFRYFSFFRGFLSRTQVVELCWQASCPKMMASFNLVSFQKHRSLLSTKKTILVSKCSTVRTFQIPCLQGKCSAKAVDFKTF